MNRLNTPLDVASLPRPLFFPGPGGSWISREEGWTPQTIWDLVARPHLFTCLPYSGRRITSFIGDFYGPPSPPIDPLSPTYTAEIDPCYFAPLHLPPPACSVSVLTTIREERSPDISGSMAFGDVGVQTGEGEEVWDIDFLIVDEVIETSDGEDEAGDQFREVGVQTILHAPHHQRTDARIEKRIKWRRARHALAKSRPRGNPHGTKANGTAKPRITGVEIPELCNLLETGAGICAATDQGPEYDGCTPSQVRSHAMLLHLQFTEADQLQLVLFIAARYLVPFIWPVVHRRSLARRSSGSENGGSESALDDELDSEKALSGTEEELAESDSSLVAQVTARPTSGSTTSEFPRATTLPPVYQAGDTGASRFRVAHEKCSSECLPRNGTLPTSNVGGGSTDGQWNNALHASVGSEGRRLGTEPRGGAGAGEADSMGMRLGGGTVRDPLAPDSDECDRCSTADSEGSTLPPSYSSQFGET